jgi:hypothetical protein
MLTGNYTHQAHVENITGFRANAVLLAAQLLLLLLLQPWWSSGTDSQCCFLMLLLLRLPCRWGPAWHCPRRFCAHPGGGWGALQGHRRYKCGSNQRHRDRSNQGDTSGYELGADTQGTARQDDVPPVLHCSTPAGAYMMHLYTSPVLQWCQDDASPLPH